MPRKKTHAEYVAELAVKNPGVTVVGEYVNARTKIEHQCACGQGWEINPSEALKGTRCKSCGNSKMIASKTRPVQKYLALIAQHRPRLKLVGEYVNMNTAVSHRCECGEVWRVRPSCILGNENYQCQKCSGRKSAKNFAHDTKNYRDWLRQHKTWIEVTGSYKNILQPAEHICTRTKKKFFATPLNIKRYGSCPCCKSYKATDADCFYIWENTQDPGVYKVGITSERCADERIAICCRKNGMTANVILMAHTPNARDIERRALELGDDPRYPDTIDGYTEFRRYSDAELGAVYQMAVQAA